LPPKNKVFHVLALVILQLGPDAAVTSRYRLVTSEYIMRMKEFISAKMVLRIVLYGPTPASFAFVFALSYNKN